MALSARVLEFVPCPACWAEVEVIDDQLAEHPCSASGNSATPSRLLVARKAVSDAAERIANARASIARWQEQLGDAQEEHARALAIVAELEGCAS